MRIRNGALAVLAFLALGTPVMLSTGPPAQADTPLRVMVVGDSITVGVNSGDGKGYRPFLADDLARRGYTVTFMVAAESGMTLDRVRPLIDAALATGPAPDVVLFNLGTNDWKWSPLDGWPERYRDEIAYVLSKNPAMRALVARPTLQPNYTGLFTNVNVWVENNTVGPLRPRAATVRMDSIPNNFLTDGVHPGDAGYLLMAGLWDRAIVNVLTATTANRK